MPPVRILFVDDEETIRLTLPPILEKHGFAVEVTATVPQALAKIASDVFDVLIADLNVGQPGDGFTVVSAMRRTYPNCVRATCARPRKRTRCRRGRKPARTSCATRRASIEVATEILTETTDAKGVFNILRDWYNNRAGRDDPKAMDKFEHGEKVIEAQKRIAVPRRQLLHYGQVYGR